MSAIDPTSEQYAGYPPLMMGLCSASYLDISDIPAAVQALGLQVVWGPEEAVDIVGISYSLGFVAQNTATNEFTVVIRGTNMISLGSWWDEDFQISNLVPLSQYAPHAQGNPMISQGTANGLTYLLALTDGNNNGENIVQFLQNQTPSAIYVTGHSLGGALTPPMVAIINDQLNGGGTITNMAWWTFAGPTSGDRSFVKYFEALWSAPFPGRYHNTLDIAPYCWWSESDVENVYVPNGLYWGFPESTAIEHLFADASPFTYTQPAGDVALQGTFYDGDWEDLWLEEWSYVAQSAYQHETTTYAALIDGMYGVKKATTVPRPSRARRDATSSPAHGARDTAALPVPKPTAV